MRKVNASLNEVTAERDEYSLNVKSLESKVEELNFMITELEASIKTEKTLGENLQRGLKTLKDELSDKNLEESMTKAKLEQELKECQHIVEGKEVEMVSMGSSLKICLVAEGSAEYYPRFAPTMEWDTGAGQAIAEAAGRSLIDWTTKERKRYNNEILRNNWFLVN